MAGSKCRKYQCAITALLVVMVFSACGGGGSGPNGSCNGCIGGPVNLGVAAVDVGQDGGTEVAVGFDKSAPYIEVYSHNANGVYTAPVSYALTPKDDSIIR